MRPEETFVNNKVTLTRIRESRSNKGLSEPWLRCFSGRRINLFDPSIVDIEIEDIATSLSRLNRWSGMTKGDNGYSVAQHSIAVVNILKWLTPINKSYLSTLKIHNFSLPQLYMTGLLHDAAEGYLGGDLCPQLKSMFKNDEFKKLEKKLDAMVYRRFGLPVRIPEDVYKIVKIADRISAYMEAVLIAGYTKKEAEMFFGIKAEIKDTAKIIPLGCAEAKEKFIKEFKHLERRMK